MLKLYFAPGTCALASQIALEEAGAAYEPMKLDFAAGDQRKPEYLKINPKGRVPALVTDKGILTESPAILAYIAQSFPAAKLAPLDDPFTFAKVQALNSYLCSTVHVNHAHRVRGARWADEPSSIEDMKRKVPATVGESMALIEQQMIVGPYVLGETYSISDPYLFTICSWLKGDGVDINTFPKLAAHQKRMGERPAVKSAMAYHAT